MTFDEKGSGVFFWSAVRTSATANAPFVDQKKTPDPVALNFSDSASLARRFADGHG